MVTLKKLPIFTQKLFLVLASWLVTRLKRELSLRRSYEQRLEAVNKDLEHFSSIVAHDLKAPLTNIQLSAELLSEDKKQDKTLTKSILDESIRLRKMVEALLKVSRTETNSIMLASLKLNSLLEGVSKTMRQQLSEHRATLIIDASDTITGSEPLLHNVFQNLIENSLKYRSKDAPRIEVRSRVTDDYIAICYEDNGKGIPPELRERAFDPFVRAASAQVTEGVGLGLSVVKKIISSHGGRIEILDKETSGTRFQILLPRAGSLGELHPLWDNDSTDEETLPSVYTLN